MRQKFLFLLFPFLQLSAQTLLLRIADSLAVYGEMQSALTLYDSLLAQKVSDTVHLWASVGSLRPLLALRRINEVHHRAEPAFPVALRLRDTLALIELLSGKGEAWTRQGKYAEASVMLDSALRLSSERFVSSASYGLVLHRIGLLKYLQGRSDEAEIWYQKARAIRAQVLGTDHPDYTWTLNNLAVSYYARGKYTEAERLLLAVRDIQARTLGESHPDYASTLHNLASVYTDQGLYTQAEELLLEVMRLREKILGPYHPDYASTINNLASLYYVQGRYHRAEKFYTEAAAIRARTLGTNHPIYASTLNNLGIIYEAMGRYAEAEKLYLQARDIFTSAFGSEHPSYLRLLNNLAALYSDQKRYAEAEQLYLQVRAIQEKLTGTEHPQYASTLNNLSELYQTMGRYAEAERFLLEAKEIREKVLGVDHPDYARLLNNLANIYSLQGRYGEAESLYIGVKSHIGRTLGTAHPDYYYYTLYSLATLYHRQRRYIEADPLWEELIRHIFQRIQRDFLAMATAHRQDLMENILYSRLMAFQSYVAERATPHLIELGYRVARSTKGILLTSTSGMRQLIESRTRDTLLQSLYQQWNRFRELYAFYTLRGDHQIADSIWRIATGMEKRIVERLPELQAFLPDLEKEPLYLPLRKGEAAVEVLRVPAERSDSVFYLFYLLIQGPRKRELKLHILRTDTAWEKRADNAYAILRSPSAELSGSAWRLLWQFMDSLLPENVHTLYFAPDGIYHRINIATLYDGKAFVAERYHIHYVATTRRLLRKPIIYPSTAPTIIGNPAFYDSEIPIRGGEKRTYRDFPGGIPPLPGAETEAKVIAELLGSVAITGRAATESFIKSLRSPKVLHIATHGYFTGAGKNPMLEGGILLAQAALWDSLYPPQGTEDGRLTAEEAATLNLLGTEVVVLSACETGLGEVRGEGLYGLRRAFLEAGAARVISALWEIDDEVTRHLMEEFYRRWKPLTGSGKKASPNNSGSTVEAAFSEAMGAVRKKYPAPYYWGAFVVMR